MSVLGTARRTEVLQTIALLEETYAREIAAGGVLVAAFGSGAVTVIVLAWKFAELLGANP